MAGENEAARRATEAAYQQLTVNDTAVNTYLTGHSWTVSAGRYSKGGNTNLLPDVALAIELMA
jgi:hypothetical protein